MDRRGSGENLALLQMIMRPQPFDLRQWHVALQKLPTLLAGTSVGSTKSGASVAHRLFLASPVYNWSGDALQIAHVVPIVVQPWLHRHW